jgi:iron-sulfur cluster repair protein YtfE (RIC family)
MSMTDEQAADAIRAHHSELQGELRKRVVALEDAVRRDASHGEPQEALLEFLEHDLLPHALAEEKTLYAAGDTGHSALLVRSMRDEHRNLIARVGSLRDATDPINVATCGAAILALFESHLSKENDLLIPALVADPAVSLDALLEGMHELVG